ncbi:MAG: hypothetical protein RIS44_2307 [Pseudomonadota bacterium]|jgi:protein-tyrosine kinase
MSTPLPRPSEPKLAALRPAKRNIGEILVSSGRLSADDAERVHLQQQKSNMPFGLTALKLKLLRKNDLDFALSKQFDYAYFEPNDKQLSPEVVAAYKPFGRAGENLRALRSQLMLRWLNADNTRKSLAILSPSASEGRSFIAANLAVVFAQHEERTLLIDGNLRAGRQQSLFRLPRGPGLSEVLAGRAAMQDCFGRVPNLPGLTVLPAGTLPPNPQELLGRKAFELLLRDAAMQFDVILIDTPAANLCADAEIIAARCDATLMVARKNVSSLPQTAELAQRLQDGGVNLLGSVLNQA